MKPKALFVAIAASLLTTWVRAAEAVSSPPTTQAVAPIIAPPRAGNALDTVKAQLHASDEEWKVINPLLRKLLATRGLALAGMTGEQPTGSTQSFNRGGPGGGPGGGMGNDSFDGPTGRGGPELGLMVSPQLFKQADANNDRKVSKAEFTALADAWFAKLDTQKTGKVTQAQFIAGFNEVLPMPEDAGARGGGGGGRGGFGPAQFIGPAFFSALDSKKAGAITVDELKASFEKWFTDWDAAKVGTIDADQLREGLNTVLPQPQFGPGGMRGGPGEGGGPRGGGGGGPNMQRQGGGPGGGFGDRRPEGNGGGGGNNNALAQAIADFRETLNDANASPERLKEKAANIHRIRQKAHADWQAAQKDLELLLTPEQNDVLIGLGYLE